MPKVNGKKRKPAGPAAPISGKTPREWADLLVDNVSTATQKRLPEDADDPPDAVLQDVDDWRGNAESLFKLALEKSGAQPMGEALRRLVELAGTTSGREWARAEEALAAAGLAPSKRGLTRLAEEDLADALAEAVKTLREVREARQPTVALLDTIDSARAALHRVGRES